MGVLVYFSLAHNRAMNSRLFTTGVPAVDTDVYMWVYRTRGKIYYVQALNQIPAETLEG